MWWRLEGGERFSREDGRCREKMLGIRVNSFSESHPATLIHIYSPKSISSAAVQCHKFRSRGGTQPDLRCCKGCERSITEPGIKFPKNQSLLRVDSELVVKAAFNYNDRQ